MVFIVEPLLKQGWTVQMDNFYNSTCIAKTLKTVHKTDCQYTKTEKEVKIVAQHPGFHKNSSLLKGFRSRKTSENHCNREFKSKLH